MVHRMIADGADSLGAAKQFEAGTVPAKQANQFPCLTLDGDDNELLLAESNSLRAGVYGDDSQLIALNRCAAEDRNEVMEIAELDEIFSGLDYHVVEGQLTNTASLASEIWKLFIVLAGLALLAEAFLCLPPKPEAEETAAVLPSSSRRMGAA